MLSFPHLFVGNGADALPNCISLYSHPHRYNSVEEYTVWRETLAVENIGEFGELNFDSPSNVFKSVNLISHDLVDLTHDSFEHGCGLTPVVSSTSPAFPDPDGPLSEKVLAKAIE